MATENVFYKEIGRRIRQARKAIGVTQQTLASRVLLSRASVTNIEQGRQKLMVHTLVEIANVLCIPLVDLIPSGDSSPKHPLKELIKQRTKTEQAWIGTALTSLKSEEAV